MPAFLSLMIAVRVVLAVTTPGLVRSERCPGNFFRSELSSVSDRAAMLGR
jgi:hypothetical protein